MNESLPEYVDIIVPSLIVGSILIGLLNTRVQWPIVGIANRWFRWLSVSLGGSYLLWEMGVQSRPFWALAIIVFLFWMLIETMYTWFVINALSQSTVALFPSFRENSSGEEWPAAKKMIELKDWLRSQGFKRVQALLSDLGNGAHVRSSVYQNETNKIRAQILFMPQTTGSIAFSVSFSSETEDGERFVTDNFQIPYGGFYPDNWNMYRKPWTRNPSKLLEAHKQRIDRFDLVDYDSDPVIDLNSQQRLLERINIEAGFLFPPQMHEEMGRITWEGKYRVWKEVWLLNYFGIATKS